MSNCNLTFFFLKFNIIIFSCKCINTKVHQQNKQNALLMYLNRMRERVCEREREREIEIGVN